MTFGPQTVVALIILSIGVYLNYNASYGSIRSKKQRKRGLLFVFLGFGLVVPFSWWQKVLLPWWSGIALGLFIATIAIVILSLTSEERRPARRRSSR